MFYINQWKNAVRRKMHDFRRSVSVHYNWIGPFSRCPLAIELQCRRISYSDTDDDHSLTLIHNHHIAGGVEYIFKKYIHHPIITD